MRIVYVTEHIVKCREQDFAAAIAKLRDENSTVQIQSIDGDDVIGTCETCGLPVTEGDIYYHDSKGTYWHKSCD